MEKFSIAIEFNLIGGRERKLEKLLIAMRFIGVVRRRKGREGGVKRLI